MKQWKTISSSDYIIDNRNRRDILDKIHKLAHSYAPEWQFNEDDPDIGSVIALLFTDQMQENIRRYNTTLERDYIELVNMLGISPRPAYPSHSIVLMSMIQDTIPGQRLRRGTKLLSGGDESFIFETAHGIYITESAIISMFMSSGQTGKMIPIKGNFEPVEFISQDMLAPIQREEEPEEVPEELTEGVAEETSEENSDENTARVKQNVIEQLELAALPDQDDTPDENSQLQEFTLFDFSKEGYGKTGLVMYHAHLFDEVDNDIWMDLAGSDHLAERIVKGEYSLFYYGENGFVPITDLRVEKGRYLVFRKSGECRKIRIEQKDYSALLLKPEGVVEKNVVVSDIRFSASGENSSPEYVLDSTSELNVEHFYPFGRVLSLFTELYIGHRYFNNPGAMITLEFDLDFEQQVAAPPEAKVEDSLKIIKRKPKRDVVGAVAEVYADEVSAEYFNGTGWKKLPMQTPIGSLFRVDTAGHCSLSFVCPEDWRETETGGYDGRCIRLQLLRADNCYFQPAMHHTPVITDLKISYTYARKFERPKHLVTFQGSKQWDITNRLAENEICPILFRSGYNDTSLYIGFDKKMVDGPIGLMFQIGDTEQEIHGKLIFSYSTRDGFSRLKLTDRTDGLNHTGLILFMPPTDMAKVVMEGQEAYWIKITDEDFYLEKNPKRRPLIQDIQVNAVEVDNIETMDEEEYYIDAYEPNMSFPLTATNILRVEVWVNETADFTAAEMRQMLLEEPGKSFAEYDIRGEIRDFYIRWEEVDNFDQSSNEDRHYVIDRMNNRIHFGDGVNVKIPKNTSGPAFKTVVRCCDGKRANLVQNQVDDSLTNLQFVKDIHNPIRSYGGMDMESMDEALRRGTTMLNTRKKLITTADYEREVLDFSHSISQVKVISGTKKDGTFDPGAVTVVLLMEDYKDGRSSFINLKKRLKDHLMKRCELTIDSQNLEVVEPIFVEVSVEAWIRVVSEDDSFEVQQRLTDMLEDYLDPVKNNVWEIGRDVVESQIELRLNMEKGSSLISKMMITCRYRDESGTHETELSSLRGNPYTIVVSGEHKIHFD